MSELQVTARLRVHDGKLAEFKAAAEQCAASVREKDSGTLQYDWFFNEDETECVVRERYRDSDAILEHIGNLGDTLGALLGACDMSLELYGDPSPDLMAASEGLSVEVYRFFLAP
jgi:quinol monooxygenase YgiN